MNLHDYILSNDLANTDPGVIATGYITAVLALPDQDSQVAALEPSVRPLASRLASTIRRAQRGGPAHAAYDSQEPYGGPAHPRDDSHTLNGGPAVVPAWALANAPLIAWCRDHQDDHYFIPGSGRRKLAEITSAEWEERARWLSQSARGMQRSAGTSQAFADLIQAAGGVSLADVLEAAGPAAGEDE